MVYSNTQQKGGEAEQAACHFLEKKGFTLLERNYRCYHGEIDLIMQDQDSIVFVEVRSRHRTDYGNAVESITASKKKKLIKAALHYLQRSHLYNKVMSRFDVIAIHPIAHKMELEWIKNAFDVSHFC